VPKRSAVAKHSAMSEYPCRTEDSSGPEHPGVAKGALHHRVHTLGSAAEYAIEALLLFEHPVLMAQHAALVSRNPALEFHDAMIDVSAGAKVHNRLQDRSPKAEARRPRIIPL